MNSLDSWIDLREISDLVNQLMPEENSSAPKPNPAAAAGARPSPFQPVSPPPQSLVPDEAPPKPLVPTVPPEWEMAQPDEHAPGAFPSLDDLPLPVEPPQRVVTPSAPPPVVPAAQSRLPEPVKEENPIFKEAASEPEPEKSTPGAFTEEEIQRAAENLTLAPDAREKILGTLAEIREMAGDFLGPENPPSAEETKSEPESKSEPEAESKPLAAVAETSKRALFLPDGTLTERLKAFASWVRGITSCTQLHISDPQGYALLPAESDEDAPLVSSSLQLMNALTHARKKMDADGPNSGVYLPIGDDRWLGVLDCESGGQRVCVSMVTAAPLSASAADELTSGLKRVLDGSA